MISVMDASSDWDGSVWVWVGAWELGDQPVAGAVLPHEGIRVRGKVEPSHSPMREGVSPTHEPLDDPDAVEYVVTGAVVSASDYQADMGSGLRHAGTDVVLSVNGDPVQAQIAGPARDLQVGSVLSVRGPLLHIADYEWDGFGLVETRRAWLIEEVKHLTDSDLMLRLRPTGAQP